MFLCWVNKKYIFIISINYSFHLTLDQVYHSTAKFFNDCISRMGIHVTYVDMTDVEATRKAMRTNTTVFF